ncbi:GNAT family N-acetyltransferase [Spirosoma pollinicola]|uniref:GNAT family N-acetyltransferase n=1 Tax=Spirosoma pollinicola TaxID=2057025 RepID=A0A2K8YWY1_9BACT|nr:GNAT family N-acetyltransferase [Spirosoma pollinicola]AUD02132.1 GNAT family N-acetyltransferase [Spirosoma pollinicola]
MLNHPLMYRRANPADAPNIVRLTLRAYHDYKAVLAPADWTKMETNLAQEHLFVELLDKAAAFVCEIGNQLAGVIFLMPSGNPTTIFPADWSYIRLLGVDPDYRGLGIGRRLTEHCIHYAQITGEIGVALHTSEFMNDARKMYEKLGFKQEKELAPIYDKRYWLYKLSF